MILIRIYFLHYDTKIISIIQVINTFVVCVHEVKDDGGKLLLDHSLSPGSFCDQEEVAFDGD